MVRVFYFLFRSPLAILAALSVVLLLGTALWRITALLSADVQPTYAAADSTAHEEPPQDAEYQQALMLFGLATSSDPSAAYERDPIELIAPVVVAQLVGHYTGLVETGRYSESTAAAAAESIAENVRAVVTYKTYSEDMVRTDADVSYERMLAYRSDMRLALEPLLENTRSEFEIYGEYVETRDAALLDELRAVAMRYRDAAGRSAALVVPRDAASYHRDILNALERFAATLDAMAEHADDALASVALLRTYNAAEQDVFYAFDALARYYKAKTP